MTKTRTDLAAIWPPTSGVAREAGHKPQSPLRAIRDKCLDCSCYQVSEVRLCEAVKCPLWPFRAGKHPWWGEGGKTGQTLANYERQTAFQDEGLDGTLTAALRGVRGAESRNAHRQAVARRNAVQRGRRDHQRGRRRPG
jgi:hypothetical protein